MIIKTQNAFLKNRKSLSNFTIVKIPKKSPGIIFETLCLPQCEVFEINGAFIKHLILPKATKIICKKCNIFSKK